MEDQLCNCTLEKVMLEILFEPQILANVFKGKIYEHCTVFHLMSE